MAERYLLLEQPRGRERSIRLSLTASSYGDQWDVKRTTLHGAGKGSASEMLERAAALTLAEERYEFFTRNYLERGWYPPECQQLDKRDLITRFVHRWPELPQTFSYDAEMFARDAEDYLRDAAGRTIGLRYYRGGRRMLLRVGIDHAIVLSDACGLRQPAPSWLAQAVQNLESSTLPAVFEIRLHEDKLTLSDVLFAKRDVRALPFSARWTLLQEVVGVTVPRIDAAYVQLDAVLEVTDLAAQVHRAITQGYDDVVVRDQSRPYHYGLAPQPRGYVAWDAVG